MTIGGVITILWVLSIGSSVLASDLKTLPGADKHTSSLECSFCCEPCFNQKIAVLPCAHIEHANCYDSWRAKGGACPTCRQPGAAVKTCRSPEEAVPVLQQCTFTVQKKLNDAKAQLTEVTARRDRADEQVRTLTTDLERAQEELRARNVQVATLASQVNRMQSERTYFHGTALIASGLIIVVYGVKKMLDVPATHASTRRD